MPSSSNIPAADAIADTHPDDGGRFIGGGVVIPTHPGRSAAVAFLNKLLINPARYVKYPIAPAPNSLRNCKRDIFLPALLSFCISDVVLVLNIEQM
jgi:hypothetical protein